MPPVPRLKPAHTTLLIVDVQEKLIPSISRAAALLVNLEFLIDAASLAGVPVKVTEQYPQGLGPTVLALTAKLPPHRPAKKAFSCCAAPGLVDSLDRESRPWVLLAGIESHVCVSQTALDLLDLGFRVAVAYDAVGARFPTDHYVALERLRESGVLLTTVEAATFEWIGTAEHPAFKTFSQLVQERSRRLREANA